MIQAHIDNRKTIPWWAALGAPLIGIPILVALLALSAPSEPVTAVDHETAVGIEQVEVQSVEHALDLQDEASVKEG